jgi:uncharacterized membrane protein YkoI
MHRKLTLSLLTAAAVVAGAGIASANTAEPTLANSAAFAGHQYASSAQVTLAQARTIALKARPGQITDQELEKEGGGSGLRYSFDVKSHGKTYEVGVDAKSGKVLENGGESATAEAAEAAAETHAAH